MRVLQLIDSLHPGGAERMAVTIANELAKRIDGSFLCATREEGLLKNDIAPNVEYVFLNKNAIVDFIAIKKLKNFIKLHEIAVIHAHSSSFFYGWLLKILNPKVRLIWHDHYGNSEQLGDRSTRVLRFCSLKFSAIIAVNTLLEQWSTKHLHCKKVRYIKNFVSKNEPSKTTKTLLHGAKGKRILCVANLRPQKDHQNLIKAFAFIKKGHTDASLHIIGAGDSIYGAGIIEQLEENGEDAIYYYGPLSMTASIYKQATLGVLSSLSEGLPVSLLEYGLYGLTVVVTDVGQCKEVVSNFGKVVLPKNPKELAERCIFYLDQKDKAEKDAADFKNHILTNYSFNSIFEQLLQLYKV